MAVLDSFRRDAKSGNPTSLMIFLHGYGADGNDLLGLADPLAEHLPNTVFVAPNAPQPCVVNPMGFQWFPIPRIDGSTEAASLAGLQDAHGLLSTWLDETLKTEGMSAQDTVLFGFSQGTMMSLHTAPRREDPFAGIIGFSGRLLIPESLENDAISKPPVLLVHGDQDDVVPPESLPLAADALTKAKFEVFTHTSKGTAHGIAPDGLGVALQFAKQKLGA